MHADLVNVGWTEEQWNLIVRTVTEEAQKARIAAQMLPVSGPEDASTVAIPNFTLTDQANPNPPRPTPPQPDPLPAPQPPFRPWRRLAVDSDPTLFITTIAVNVALRTHEVADLELSAALVMFRRAANVIARIEDALIFNGRPGPDMDPPFGMPALANVCQVSGNGVVAGIFVPPGIANLRNYQAIAAPAPPPPPPNLGQRIVPAIVASIDALEAQGQVAPYACVLAHDLFEAVCDPTASMVLPRDRILPFLQGPLLRSSAVQRGWGAVVALSGSPVEIVVANDIDVRFLQTTLEPRLVFRVSERIALRIKEERAIAIFN
jgi:uncharacterized linocin/CFP29 family protein